MKILVLSDIHGNLEALTAVLNDAKNEDWKEIWFLGDLCGYGPEPDACFRKLQDHPLTFIPGNHDLYICGRMKGEFFSRESRKALILSRSFISRELIDYMKQLPSYRIQKGVELVHASPEGPSRVYILDEEDALRNFKISRKKCILFGHSHIQEYYTLEKTGLYSRRASNGETLSFKKSRVLINPGSVGQPRDRDPRAAWGILDLKNKDFTFYRSSYDYEITQGKMKKAGFSEFLINRIARGE
ncbi:metallophosphoesterase family protein [Oceanispirochaeta sp.]|uniref:metallophosphoesterase family protein n=1 Tax=Oceanispirochaeta sp. TaxID=2035350 RepID=UPI002639CD35|nr:metallophosphoesterase family protein [Oceanispirochaeta sp.]MDA3956123.1 metallophosphoesterase family protein [Oceanispirochaeta sp.]